MTDVLGAALRLISYRPRTEEEVRKRLSRRYSKDEVERAVSSLKEGDYLNDLTFAIHWRQDRESHHPRSGKMVRYELLRLGVARDLVEEALEGYDEEDNAHRAGEKVAAKLSGLDYEAFRRKLAGYLARRGFGGGTIRPIVNDLWRKLAHPDDSAVDGQR